MSKKTYERVVNILNNSIPLKISRNEFCRITGVNRNSVDRYLSGLGQPTDETLKKISEWSGRSVAWLRGDDNLPYNGFISHDRMVQEEGENNTELMGYVDREIDYVMQYVEKIPVSYKYYCSRILIKRLEEIVKEEDDLFVSFDQKT